MSETSIDDREAYRQAELRENLAATRLAMMAAGCSGARQGAVRTELRSLAEAVREWEAAEAALGPAYEALEAGRRRG